MLHFPSAMASEGPKPVALSLLFLNLVLYAAVAAVAGWVVNYGVDDPDGKVDEITVPASIFPVYYPMGNLATGFFVAFALLAGVVGAATSLSGLQSLAGGSPSGLASAAASSLVSWSLVLLAMGAACKEISLGWRPASLRTMEALTIILTGTQLLCAGAIHATLTSSADHRPHNFGGRV